VREAAYTRSFERALYKQRANDFLARPLSLDDREFIRRICDTGRLECGALSQLTRSWDGNKGVLDEERSYWETHWEEEPGVSRKIGEPRPPRPSHRRPLTPEEKISLSRARAEAYREWKAEQDRLREERERRLNEALLADLEWEAADEQVRAKLAAQVGLKAGVDEDEEPTKPPRRDHRKPAPPGALVIHVDSRNHYIPEWKYLESAEGIAEYNAKWRQHLDQLDERLEAARWVIAQRLDAARIEKDREAAGQFKREQAAAERAQQRYRQERELRRSQQLDYQIRFNVKQQILKVIRGSPHEFTLKDLMWHTGCTNRELLASCANELAREGEIGRNDP